MHNIPIAQTRASGCGVLGVNVGYYRGTRMERSAFSLLSGLLFGVMLILSLLFSASTGRADDVQRVTMGDTTFYIPKAWVERGMFKVVLDNGTATDEPSDRDYVAERMAIIVPGDRWKKLAPIVSSPLPRFSNIIFVPGDEEPYALKQLRARLASISAMGAPDEDGFWNWRLDERLLVGSEKSRPLSLPLIVNCDLPGFRVTVCTGHLYLTERLVVRYIFGLRDFPKSKWRALDEELQAFMLYLMTPK